MSTSDLITRLPGVVAAMKQAHLSDGPADAEQRRDRLARAERRAPILDTLVRPTRPIPVEATAIHKITDAMVASAPSWPEVAEQYAAAVAGRTVVAYNVAFDARLLRQTYQIHGLTAPVLTTACAMLMYAEWHGEYDRSRDRWRWLKLIEAATDCGVAEDGAHRALADARMTLGVLRYLQRRTNGRRPAGPKVATVP
jgi:DNA polymerase III epsilon subunit-like protein